MELNLEILRSGYLGLTPEVGSNLLQACTVCLDKFDHKSGVILNIKGNEKVDCILHWDSEVTVKTKRNWNDLQEATEYGATAIAILLAGKFSNCSVIERSSKGTGFDYWLGDDQNESIDIFNYKERLEISGILVENSSNSIKERVSFKKKQIEKTNNTSLNAHICVTDFSTPKTEYHIIKP